MTSPIRKELEKPTVRFQAKPHRERKAGMLRKADVAGDRPRLGRVRTVRFRNALGQSNRWLPDKLSVLLALAPFNGWRSVLFTA